MFDSGSRNHKFFRKGGCTQDASTVTTELSTFITQVETGLVDYNTANLATILMTGIALAAAPAICWFAYRFIKGKVTKALFKGRL